MVKHLLLWCVTCLNGNNPIESQAYAVFKGLDMRGNRSLEDCVTFISINLKRTDCSEQHLNQTLAQLRYIFSQDLRPCTDYLLAFLIPSIEAFLKKFAPSRQSVKPVDSAIRGIIASLHRLLGIFIKVPNKEEVADHEEE